MTPYQRRWIAAAAVAATITTTGAACAHPDAPVPAARPTVAAIAPGGNITSIQQATAARGWPHRPDANERADIRGIVVATFAAPSAPARISCAFGRTIGAPIRCRLRTGRADLLVFIGLPATRTATGRILPRVPGVWEDGSYRISAVISATEED